MAPRTSVCRCSKCAKEPLGYAMQLPRTAREHLERDAAMLTAVADASRAGPSNLPIFHPPPTRPTSPLHQVPRLSPVDAFAGVEFLDDDDPMNWNQNEDSDEEPGVDEADTSAVQPDIPHSPFRDRQATPFEQDQEVHVDHGELNVDAMLSTHVNEAASMDLIPTPQLLEHISTLPPFVHSFVHHDLPEAERMVYTNAAVASVSGSDHASVSATLAFSNSLRESCAQTESSSSTTDPFEAYTRLGVNPDPLIRRFAVCEIETCCYLVPLPQLGSFDNTDGHPHPSGKVCKGRLFTSRDRKRQPLRILAFTPLSTTLQTFMRDFRFVDNLQSWRGDATNGDDAIGEKRPHHDSSEAFQRDRQWTSVFDGSAWRAREAYRTRTVMNEEVRENNNGPSQRLVSLEFGLQAAMNIDWFAVHDVVNCPIAAVYVTILNLPRHMTFKKAWTSLALVIPGPSELSTLALNNVLKPLVDDLKLLERGVLMHIHGRSHPQPVYLQMMFSASDMPAIRKLAGSMGHAFRRPCNHCYITKAALKEDEGYDWRSFPVRRPQELLDAAARHRSANDVQRSIIEKKDAIRWSETVRLVGFQHSSFSPPDTMHNSALGITKSLVLWIVKHSGLLDDDDPTADVNRFDILEAEIKSVTWPSHIGRLAVNVIAQLTSGGDASRVKADEWNRIRSALPHALLMAFKNPATGTIDNPKRLQVYRCVVDIAASLRILLARTVREIDLDDAQDLLADAAIRLRKAGMPMTINWHVAMHYAQFIRLYGPVGSFTTWAYERNNGVIARTRFFKGDIVQMTTTAARRWLKELLLAAVIRNPSPQVTSVEKAYLDDIELRMDAGQIKGTLLLEEHRGNASALRIVLPKPLRQSLNLRTSQTDVYRSTLEHLQRSYPQLSFHTDTEVWAAGPPLHAGHHRQYPYVKFNGYRFCSAQYTRSKRDRWAIARQPDGTHCPCRVELIFAVNVGDIVGVGGPNGEVVAAVTFLESADDELLGWSFRSFMLGQRLVRPPTEANHVTVIPVDALVAAAAAVKTETELGSRITIISYDKEGNIDEVDLDDDEDDDYNET